MRRSELWGSCLALAMLVFASAHASGAPSTTLVNGVHVPTWEESSANLGDLPIERNRGVQLVSHHRRPRHVHCGSPFGGNPFGGCHQKVVRPVRYNAMYFGVPGYPQQWRMYYGPGAFSQSYYRAYYGGFGGGCRTAW